MIKTNEPHLDVAAASHPGMTGKKNEDRYAVTSFVTELKEKTPAVLAVLSDGIGGHRAGEVAAQMAVEQVTNFIASSDGDKPLFVLEEAIIQANRAIYNASLSDKGRVGMGATCACAWIIDDRLYTANLGDSRIYLLRGGKIIQLTTDHTWIQEAFDAGIIDESASAAHPNAHVIRRYLGSLKPPHPDFRLWFFDGESDIEALNNQGLGLHPGDIVLICSDGLTDLVTDDEIIASAQNNPFKELPNVLIDKANKRGGHDNITVVLLRVPGKLPQQSKLRRRGWVKGCLTLTILIIVIAGAYFGWRWLASRLRPISTPEPQSTQIELKQTPFETQAVTQFATSLTPEQQVETITLVPSMTPWPTHTPLPQ